MSPSKGSSLLTTGFCAFKMFRGVPFPVTPEGRSVYVGDGGVVHPRKLPNRVPLLTGHCG